MSASAMATVASSSTRRLLAFLTIAIGLGALCTFFRARATSFEATATEADYDIPPFPATVVRPFSFGLRSVVADVMFLEAIQVYGGRPKKGNQTAAAGAKSD